MLWNGQTGLVPRFDEDYVAAVLPVFPPPGLLKCPNCPFTGKRGQSGHLCRYLNLVDRDRQRHVVRRPRRQTPSNRLPNVLHGLSLRLPLGDATGNRRALYNDHPILVSFQRHKKFHTLIVTSYRAPCNLPLPRTALLATPRTTQA